MKCPECDYFKVFEEYNKSNTNGVWQREIYCPACHHHTILPVTDDESLEDFAERQLQRIHDNIKRSIVKAFTDGGEYNDGLILQDNNDSIVNVTVSVKRDDNYFKKIKKSGKEYE